MLGIKAWRFPSWVEAPGYSRPRYQRRNIVFGIQAQASLRAEEVKQCRDVLFVELARVMGKLFMTDFVEGNLDRTAKRSALLSKYLQVVR